jgi:fucose 4-O-acetylase-like acetyltransferase
VRNQTVDALKGYAIILVVLGHVIENSIYQSDHNRIYELIYSFHMPLFMFLSGYIIFGTVKKPASKWLWSKVERLLIPFFIWFLIWSIFGQFDFIKLSFINVWSGVQAHLLNDVVDPLTTPWFLLVLFMFYCILLVINYLEKYLGYFVYIWIFLFLCIQPAHDAWLIFLRWYYAFFFIGYLIAEHRDKLPMINAKVKLILTLIFCGSFITLFSLYPNRQYIYMAGVTLPAPFAFKFSIAWLGIAASYALISWFRNKWIIRPLSYLGLYTLDIYVLHVILIKCGLRIYSAVFLSWNLGIYPAVIFVTLFALLLSLGVSRVLRFCPILKYVLFGSKS